MEKNIATSYEWEKKVMDYFRQNPISTRKKIALYFGYKSSAAAGDFRAIGKNNTFVGMAMARLFSAGKLRTITYKIQSSPKGTHVIYAPEFTNEQEVEKYCNTTLVSEYVENRRQKMAMRVDTRQENFLKTSEVAKKSSDDTGEIENCLASLVYLIKKHSEKQVGSKIRELEAKITVMNHEKDVISEALKRATNHEEKGFLQRILGNV